MGFPNPVAGYAEWRHGLTEEDLLPGSPNGTLTGSEIKAVDGIGQFYTPEAKAPLVPEKMTNSQRSEHMLARWECEDEHVQEYAEEVIANITIWGILKVQSHRYEHWRGGTSGTRRSLLRYHGRSIQRSPTHKQQNHLSIGGVLL